MREVMGAGGEQACALPAKGKGKERESREHKKNA